MKIYTTRVSVEIKVIRDCDSFTSPSSVIGPLRQVTYVKKTKQARIQEKQTLNVTFGSWFFLFDFEMTFLNAWKSLN